MTVDHFNLFSSDFCLLQEVSQFHSSLNNKLISANENFLVSAPFECFNEMLKQELLEYKVFDC